MPWIFISRGCCAFKTKTMYLMFKWTPETMATWKWEICKWEKYGSCQRKRRKNFFPQLLPVIELRSSSLCADVMMEVIRREIRRRCLKLCKLHNPGIFYALFRAALCRWIFREYFIQIRSCFDVRAISKVISWFILMNSSFFDSSRPLMASRRQPIIRYAKTKSFPPTQRRQKHQKIHKRNSNTSWFGSLLRSI